MFLEKDWKLLQWKIVKQNLHHWNVFHFFEFTFLKICFKTSKKHIVTVATNVFKNQNESSYFLVAFYIMRLIVTFPSSATVVQWSIGSWQTPCGSGSLSSYFFVITIIIMSLCAASILGGADQLFSPLPETWRFPKVALQRGPPMVDVTQQPNYQ